MLGKALCLSLGLFLCGSLQAAEEKLPGTLEEISASQETEKQNAARTDSIPEPAASSQPVYRCARGVYSFDCSTPKAVMRADLALIDKKPVCTPRNFLSPGWRCD